MSDLNNVIRKFFQKTQWIDAAVEDDDVVISRAMGSRRFADLWTANPDGLAHAHPDPSGVRPYDSSSADAALARQLAIWCSGNHGQIKRLMLRSGLARDKWHQHDSDLDNTIIKAVAAE